MKNWLIKKLGGYTFEEYSKNGDLIDNYSRYEELSLIKRFMEDNYGVNWSAELYQKILDRIVELSNKLNND